MQLTSAEGTPGNTFLASRANHAHERLSSAGNYTLNGVGETTITFSRTFAVKPAAVCLLDEAGDTQPVVFKVASWVQDGNGFYTGCTVKGYRSSLLPALSGILLLGPLVSALANFNVFGGSAAGVKFSFLALQPST